MITPRGSVLRLFMATMPLSTRWKYAIINANRVASWLMKQAVLGRRTGPSANVACTKANVAANALYRSIGMKVVGEYHYNERITDERE